MPYDVTFFELPCGARAFRLEVTGVFSGEEAAALIKQVDPGGELEGLPSLVLTRKLDSVASAARGAFARRGDLGDRETLTAVVVTNPVIRVTANFIIRIQRSRRTRLFGGEAEALQWLDARALEGLAKMET